MDAHIGCVMQVISPALGFPEGIPAYDIRTGALKLGNMKNHFGRALCTKSTRFEGQQELAEAAIFWPGLKRSLSDAYQWNFL
jgi:hypothetical protein